MRSEMKAIINVFLMFFVLHYGSLTEIEDDMTRALTGTDCQYVRLYTILTNTGCISGTKFVLKPSRAPGSEVRRQFVILNNEVILAFVKKGKKITECDSYTDVTSQITCKEVA